jgi:hypothetical protein
VKTITRIREQATKWLKKSQPIKGTREKQIHRKVVSALKELVTRDKELLLNNVNERAITHRLGAHVQGRFRGWNVDCEYNRNHDDVKRLHLKPRSVMTDDTEGQTVFPDIIVHKRYSDTNLLVVEVKKSTNNHGDHYDLQKLRAFKAELGYQYAVFVKLSAGPSDR